MAWTPDFLREIGGAGKAIAPYYVLETILPPEEIGRGSWRLVSHEQFDGLPILGRGGSRFQGTQITPRSWSSTTGAWSVPLVGDCSSLKGRLWRGQLVQLRVGFVGWSLDEFEPVMLGQVWALRGSPNRYTLELRDIFSALQSRIDSTADEQPLFHDVGSATTLAANYAVGDATLTVASTAGFSRETGGSGVVRVTPTSGSAFYLTYTGTAAAPARFTGCSAAGQFGTTAAVAASGKAVAEVAYIGDHPIDVAGKILASTGAGTNGAYDSLPSSWGLAFPHLSIDRGDMVRWQPYTSPDAGAVDWRFLSTTPQSNALDWLQSRLAQGGFFLAIRQGQITCRGAIDICDGSTACLDEGVPLSGMEVTDEDVVSWDHWEAWDSSYGTESDHTRIVTYASSSATSGHINGLPAIAEYEYDLSGLIFDNDDEHQAALRGRLAHWCNRIPERVVCTTGGLSHARLCPGDIVPITTQHFGPRDDSRGDGYVRRPAMVTRCSPDWWRGGVQLDLAVQGYRDNEYA
jgi:hypothetical protein